MPACAAREYLQLFLSRLLVRDWRNLDQVAGLACPHRRHLVPQAPGFEFIEILGQGFHRGADFVAIVRESAERVVRNRVIVLANVRQHTK